MRIGAALAQGLCLKRQVASHWVLQRQANLLRLWGLQGCNLIVMLSPLRLAGQKRKPQNSLRIFQEKVTLPAACSPEEFCEYFFRVCLGILHWKMAGIFGEFFWSPSPTKRSTKSPWKIRWKFGAKFGAKFGTKIRKIRETFVLQLFWRNKRLLQKSKEDKRATTNVQPRFVLFFLLSVFSFLQLS